MCTATSWLKWQKSASDRLIHTLDTLRARLPFQAGNTGYEPNLYPNSHRFRGDSVAISLCDLRFEIAAIAILQFGHLRPVLTCFHASFFFFSLFAAFAGHPSSSPSLRTFLPFSPPRKVLCSVLSFLAVGPPMLVSVRLVSTTSSP